MISMEELPSDIKSLIIEWLKDAAIAATEKASKSALLYNRCLDKVRRYEGAIRDLKTLKSIPYIGDKTAKYLVDRLRTLCEENSFTFPEAFGSISDGIQSKKRKQLALDGSLLDSQAKRSRKERKYIPKKRSGGYAILLALYFIDKRRAGLRKEEIIEYAGAYSDKSFKANPSLNEFYSAWNSIKILMSHDLVDCINRNPKLYVLTQEGYNLAVNLKLADHLCSSPTQEGYDISYDNNIRVTPNNSSIGLSLDSSPTKSYSDKQEKKSSQLFVSSSNCSSPKIPIFRGTSKESEFKKSSSLTLSNSLDLATIKANHDIEGRSYFGIKYEIWPPEDYEIVIIVDNREIRSKNERDFFQTRLGGLGMQCEVRSLSLGDVVWIAKHKVTKKEVVLNCICERKRLDDLVSSIRDGRFREQKERLKRSGMKSFYYLVEELLSSKLDIRAGTIESIQTAMSMIMTVSNFHLRKFKDIEATIVFLSSLTRVITDDLRQNRTKLIVLKPNDIRNQIDYNNTLSRFRSCFETRKTSYECVHLFSTFQDTMGKNGMLMLKQVFIQMLMSIRGISLERAIALQKYFRTPKGLISCFKSNSHLSEDGKNTLVMNLFKDEVGNKKIGRSISERIYSNWGR